MRSMTDPASQPYSTATDAEFATGLEEPATDARYICCECFSFY